MLLLLRVELTLEDLRVFTGDPSERHKTWDMLKFIRSSSPLLWVCIRDFNEILHRSEHVRVQERSASQIAAFREMVDVCGLNDIGFSGRSWTFEKKVSGGSFYRSCALGSCACIGELEFNFPFNSGETLCSGDLGSWER